jgi:UDP-2,3-diacylglucosamine pyrophosphatase LpxH
VACQHAIRLGTGGSTGNLAETSTFLDVACHDLPILSDAGWWVLRGAGILACLNLADKNVCRTGRDAMLVIISDLHLTDGTNGASLPAGAFSIFAERLQDLAVAASHRTDGSYRPIDRIDLILLGDILDCIRSSHWLAGQIRPWSDPHSPEFFNTISRITSDILRENELSLAVLRSLSEHQGICIRPATDRGRMADGDEQQPVAVRIFYLVGNHDWFFHLPGPHYDRLRTTLAEKLALANPANQPFPHDPAESEPILETMRRHKILARHGDIYDPFNFEEDRNTSSLGDAITVELVGRFAEEVQRELGAELAPATIAGLREIDNIRPSLLAPVWIDGLLERTCAVPAQRKKVKMIWDRLTDRFLALDFVRSRDTWSPIDMVDGLARVLKFSKRLNTGWASAILGWLHSIRGPGDASYHRHALAEQDFRNRRAKHIVYGHTHFAESVPLDASYAEGYVLNQVYFNAGTWRRVYRQTQLAPSEHEFIASDCMTYLAFFQADERGGRPYETWSGTLGLGTRATTVRRFDSPHAGAPTAPHILLPRPGGVSIVQAPMTR